MGREGVGGVVGTGAELSATPASDEPRRRRRHAIRFAKGVVGALLIVALVFSLRSQFSNVRADLARISILWLVLAMALAVLGVGSSLFGWRALLGDLGSPLPLGASVRVYSISQLGKYVPGSVWPVLAQMELGRAYGVPRTRAATAFLLALLFSVTSATAIGGLLGLSQSGWGRFCLLLPLVLVLLHPRLIRPLAGLAARILRRPDSVEPLSLRGAGLGAFWMSTQWLLYGLGTSVLAAGLGAHLSVPRVVAAAALAWAAGLVVVFVPAGAGVRESVLVVLLAGEATTSVAVALALLSRLTLTAADGLWALVGLLVRNRSTVNDAATEQIEN
ncbi:MAG TPA: lysylphosphatidylglycerol synthase domain-containing protein [Frankiaceae bacterium]|nr:lysylphosphatidylglycerol synthase domain-containing protein [Frankiaceae bacterium]